DLRALHQVGASVGAADEPARVLDLVTAAARSIGNARAACAVVRPTPNGPCLWAGGLALSDAARAALESGLLGPVAERGPTPPALPEGCQAFVIPDGRRPLGFLVVEGWDETTAEPRDVLGILAEQAATRLLNIRLVGERLEADRLSTLGHMLSTIVHDFRNPMTAIKGYAGMIEGFELPRERLLDCSRQILDECDRMTAMIEEILEFTRGGRTPMSPARIPIVELCSRLRQHMAHDFEERGARFEAELAYRGPVVLDLDRMTRALANIASNALDAMGRGGVFTFASRLTGAAVELVLSDTGPGVPAALAGRVFEPFFSSGKPRGVGLGMSIARRIVEEHGGLIRLTTSAPEGARFIVSLPLDDDPAPSAPAR
ncbi:MAG: HAMP domain-containing histidine kinase, partial [Candidatus Rokubacteria bacterium]|nr:HAMP domain-containing histidine kinase [Candidatus Rokubacteria bacterium]